MPGKRPPIHPSCCSPLRLPHCPAQNTSQIIIHLRTPYCEINWEAVKILPSLVGVREACLQTAGFALFCWSVSPLPLSRFFLWLVRLEVGKWKGKAVDTCHWGAGSDAPHPHRAWIPVWIQVCSLHHTKHRFAYAERGAESSLTLHLTTSSQGYHWNNLGRVP